MSERIGIVPTSGVQKVERFGQTIVEPDMEGKIRCLAALTAFVNGEIDSIHITGGAKVDGTPVSNTYVPYLRRQSRRYDFNPEKVQKIKGGLNTSSDYKRAIEILGEEKIENSITYSSWEQNRRIVARLSTFGIKSAQSRDAEVITSSRSGRHPKVVKKVMDEVRKRTKIHELLALGSIVMDMLPLVGKKQWGYRIEYWRAARTREAED